MSGSQRSLERWFLGKSGTRPSCAKHHEAAPAHHSIEIESYGVYLGRSSLWRSWGRLPLVADNLLYYFAASDRLFLEGPRSMSDENERARSSIAWHLMDLKSFFFGKALLALTVFPSWLLWFSRPRPSAGRRLETSRPRSRSSIQGSQRPPLRQLGWPRTELWLRRWQLALWHTCSLGTLVFWVCIYPKILRINPRSLFDNLLISVAFPSISGRGSLF